MQRGLDGRRIAPFATVTLASCTTSPSQDVLGSFFPSWLICALLGIVAAVLVHRLLVLLHVADQVPAAPLIHAAFAAACSVLIWLVWFAH